MALKTIVKVGNISNLSDARYCSGMGVDMLGISALEGQPHYLAPKLFQEIRGWISGPKVVAEVYGASSHEQLTAIIENYVPDYFELSLHEYRTFVNQLSLPCIVSVKKEEVIEINADYQNVPYLLLDEEALAAELTQKSLHYPLLLKVNSSEGLQVKLKRYPVSGVALNGSPEIRPGYKDYSDLSEILEMLEE
jgi:phosphoribosylanthranilate isomerase